MDALLAPVGEALFQYVLRLADDHLILSHRLSEWCGHAPMLEEDLALPNVALDLMGQARAFYSYAGQLENRGRDEDAFAYRRLEREYLNLLIVERPNGDFAHTLVRQLYFSTLMEHTWAGLTGSPDSTLAGFAEKAAKETAYHVRYAAEWVIRLGDGSEESIRRTQAAIAALERYLEECFQDDAIAILLAEKGIVGLPSAIKPLWMRDINAVFTRACLPPLTEIAPGIAGGRQGRHGESMGFLLAELQFVQRTFPNLQW